MPTTAYIDLESSGPPFNDEYDTPAINDVESLRKGIIKTSKNKAQAPYTILLVGETGVGKSTFLEFIANVLTGKDFNHYEFKTLDLSNEQGGFGGQSQTNSARIYELSSENGISIRILDAPGLADTRGIHQDALNKKSITNEIHNHLGYVSAVLILANGAIPRLSVSMDYALSTLPALFPKSLANNIAFLFSNVPTTISFNFPDEALPEALKHAPRFLFDNPIALQKQYLRQKGRMNESHAKRSKRSVRQAEQDALEMLVELFDWLDGLEPQPTTEIIALYEKSQDIESKITDTLAQMGQAAIKMAEIKKLMEDLGNGTASLKAFANFKSIINSPVWRRERAPTWNYLCGKPNCYSTCSMDHNIVSALLLFPVQPLPCAECHHHSHSHWSHFHSRSKWVQKQEPREMVDDDMKKKWEAAKDEKEKTEALVTTSKRTLGDLTYTMDEGMDELVRLADEYAGLSLSGSFSGLLEKAIRLLETHCENMEEQGVSRDQLEKMRASLEDMKRRLDVLKEAKAKGMVTQAWGAGQGNATATKAGKEESGAVQERKSGSRWRVYIGRPYKT